MVVVALYPPPLLVVVAPSYRLDLTLVPVQTDQLTSVLNQTPVHMLGLMSGGDLALEL